MLTHITLSKQYTRNANIVSTYFCVTYAVVIVNHISDVADNKFAESAAVLMLKEVMSHSLLSSSPPTADCPFLNGCTLERYFAVGVLCEGRQRKK